MSVHKSRTIVYKMNITNGGGINSALCPFLFVTYSESREWGMRAWRGGGMIRREEE